MLRALVMKTVVSLTPWRSETAARSLRSSIPLCLVTRRTTASPSFQASTTPAGRPGPASKVASPVTAGAAGTAGVAVVPGAAGTAGVTGAAPGVAVAAGSVAG